MMGHARRGAQVRNAGFSAERFASIPVLVGFARSRLHHAKPIKMTTKTWQASFSATKRLTRLVLLDSLKATANMDILFALIESPTKEVIGKVKDGLK
ncbi:hypothetical protein [Anaeroselena agilis]|uniref:Uncharacterized protein n=1 Tax=Anaeroselena agilis TaxID=3063788 RepID=A0ABU3NS46_9FIRM|nr:hypothetical protein [Selenomonadales bacterium 4137-cl]